MKKLIITTLSLLIVFFATAQTGKLASEGINAKANAEDPHNPLVNGIPYSQYKAEQEVLKKQKQQAAEKLKQVSKLPQIATVIVEDMPDAKETKPADASKNGSTVTNAASENTTGQYANKTIPSTVVQLLTAPTGKTTEVKVKNTKEAAVKTPVKKDN